MGPALRTQEVGRHDGADIVTRRTVRAPGPPVVAAGRRIRERPGGRRVGTGPGDQRADRAGCAPRARGRRGAWVRGSRAPAGLPAAGPLTAAGDLPAVGRRQRARPGGRGPRGRHAPPGARGGPARRQRMAVTGPRRVRAAVMAFAAPAAVAAAAGRGPVASADHAGFRAVLARRCPAGTAIARAVSALAEPRVVYPLVAAVGAARRDGWRGACTLWRPRGGITGCSGFAPYHAVRCGCPRSRGVTKRVSRADPGTSLSQRPVNSRTAMAAVGNLARMRSNMPDGSVSLTAPAWVR